MFGLSALQRAIRPETTMDKIAFIVEHAFGNGHRKTAEIAFSALAALVLLRVFKNFFKRYWFIYRLPEVLIVVCVSTCTFLACCRESVYLDYSFTVLSGEFGWDRDGVDILGAVPISTGRSFVKFPIRSSNSMYLRRTSSTAGYVRFRTIEPYPRNTDLPDKD